MDRRQVVIDALEFRRPAYVPWSVHLTIECADQLQNHLGVQDLDGFLAPHFLTVGPGIHDFEKVGEHLVRDHYGTTWNREIDKDIGIPIDWPLKEPTLKGYTFPDPNDPKWYAGLKERLARRQRPVHPFLDRLQPVRAGLVHARHRGLADGHDRAAGVRRRAARRDLRAQPGPDPQGDRPGRRLHPLRRRLRHAARPDHGRPLWRRFIKPRLARMYKAAADAGKYVSQHSCGCVQELFDDLVEMGLNMFNPFQPEVMDVFEIKRRYQGRLAFHGGMSIQKTLPFGTVQEVRELDPPADRGRPGRGLRLRPEPRRPADVPPENLVAMMEVLKAQPGVQK